MFRLSYGVADLISILSRYSRWSSRARQTHRTLNSIATCWANGAFFTLNRRKRKKTEYFLQLAKNKKFKGASQQIGQKLSGHSQELPSLQPDQVALEDLVCQEVPQVQQFQQSPSHQVNPKNVHKVIISTVHVD